MKIYRFLGGLFLAIGFLLLGVWAGGAREIKRLEPLLTSLYSRVVLTNHDAFELAANKPGLTTGSGTVEQRELHRAYIARYAYVYWINAYSDFRMHDPIPAEKMMFYTARMATENFKVTNDDPLLILGEFDADGRLSNVGRKRIGLMFDGEPMDSRCFTSRDVYVGTVAECWEWLKRGQIK